MRPRRRLLLLAAGFATVILTFGVPGTSSADPAGSPQPTTESPAPGDTENPAPDGAAIAMTQDRLVDVAGQIDQGRANEAIPGFSGISLDIGNNALNVYWRGEPPTYVRNLAVQRAQGVAINLLPAKYDAATLEAARTKLIDTYGDTMHEISIPPQGTGLDIMRTSDEQKSGPSAEEMAAVIGVDITVEITDDDPQTTNGTRLNPTQPWFAGALASRGCSTSFGVTKGSTNYMLTAAHCGTGNWYAYQTPSRLIGNVGSTSTTFKPSNDIALIKVASGTSAGNKVFDGAYNNSAGFSKYVAGYTNPYQNYHFCTSGANSGVHCGVVINNPNTSANYGDGYVQPLARGGVSSGVAVVGGDSGGPAMGPHNGGYDKMRAVGIISGGRYAVSCPATAINPGYDDNGNRKCYREVYIAQIIQSLQSFGATLKTG